MRGLESTETVKGQVVVSSTGRPAAAKCVRNSSSTWRLSDYRWFRHIDKVKKKKKRDELQSLAQLNEEQATCSGSQDLDAVHHSLGLTQRLTQRQTQGLTSKEQLYLRYNATTAGVQNIRGHPLWLGMLSTLFTIYC